MAQLTLLEAINRILRANGEQPVSSLAISGTNDTSIAQQMLEEAVTQFLVDYGDSVEITVVRTSDNKVPLADNVLQVEGRESLLRHRLIRRGKFLFDLDNNTDEFDTDPTLWVKYRIDFGELDPSFQFMIADQVAVDYQADIKGDPEVDARLRERAQRSKSIARRKMATTQHGSWLDTTDLRLNTYRKN